jgi:hypothetical protein
LLQIWEVAASLDPRGRERVIADAAGAAPATSLGARNAALFRLRSKLFGGLQQLRCNCPDCEAVCDFAVDCDAMARAALPAPGAADEQQLERDGFKVCFRLPRPDDVESAEAAAGSPFETFLLERCVKEARRIGEGPCAARDLPQPVLDAISATMEVLEPGASIGFALTCPECGSSWSAPMDVAEVLWSEIRAKAERLLLDIDTLAQAYGWSEENILSLSPVRCAGYLQLVRAAA